MRWATKIGIVALVGLLPSCAPASAVPPKLIPGNFTPDRQPDGNSIIFEDDTGLVVVDTGRHLDHQAKILAYANERRKPIRAIVNTHWHLDHNGGNQELRQVFAKARIYTSNAISGALQGFLARSLAAAQAKLVDPKLGPAERAEVKLGVDAVTNPKDLLPDVPVTGHMTLPFGKSGIQLHLAAYAATEGDTWLYDPASRTAVVGDLVVVPVPFFDTGCSEGWRRALADVAKVPFERLMPGHGPELTRAEFDTYRTAFDRLIDCARGSSPTARCIDGWRQDAAPLIRTDSDRKAVQPYLTYYIDRIIRMPAQQAEFCGPS